MRYDPLANMTFFPADQYRSTKSILLFLIFIFLLSLLLTEDFLRHPFDQNNQEFDWNGFGSFLFTLLIAKNIWQVIHANRKNILCDIDSQKHTVTLYRFHYLNWHDEITRSLNEFDAIVVREVQNIGSTAFSLFMPTPLTNGHHIYLRGKEGHTDLLIQIVTLDPPHTLCQQIAELTHLPIIQAD